MSQLGLLEPTQWGARRVPGQGARWGLPTPREAVITMWRALSQWGRQPGEFVSCVLCHGGTGAHHTRTQGTGALACSGVNGAAGGVRMQARDCHRHLCVWGRGDAAPVSECVSGAWGARGVYPHVRGRVVSATCDVPSRRGPLHSGHRTPPDGVGVFGEGEYWVQ